MALLPPVPTFPEPGKWIKAYDPQKRDYKFTKLIDWRYPLRYPIRIGSVASEATSSRLVLSDLDPAERLDHRYALLVGFRPGAIFRLYHPYDLELFNWDTNPQYISRDLTRSLTYAESPYDAPKLMLWVYPNRYPAVEAINVMERTSTPEISVQGCKYKVLWEDAAAPEFRPNPSELAAVKNGVIDSLLVSFGGEI